MVYGDRGASGCGYLACRSDAGTGYLYLESGSRRDRVSYRLSDPGPVDGDLVFHRLDQSALSNRTVGRMPGMKIGR